MASAVIHMAVANEINKKLKRNNDLILIGSIAPDIAKFIGVTKVKNHFLESVENEIPQLDKFLEKYKDNLDDDFVLGYFIHLYTDYFWFKYFIPEINNNDLIYKLDGTVIKCNDDEFCKYVYNDYTNLNVKLLDEYNMDLKIFYSEVPEIKNIIEEIPMNKIDVIINRMSIIIENTKGNKDFLFNMENINSFISTCVDLILSELDDLLII